MSSTFVHTYIMNPCTRSSITPLQTQLMRTMRCFDGLLWWPFLMHQERHASFNRFGHPRGGNYHTLIRFPMMAKDLPGHMLTMQQVVMMGGELQRIHTIVQRAVCIQGGQVLGAAGGPLLDHQLQHLLDVAAHLVHRMRRVDEVHAPTRLLQVLKHRTRPGLELAELVAHLLRRVLLRRACTNLAQATRTDDRGTAAQWEECPQRPAHGDSINPLMGVQKKLTGRRSSGSPVSSSSGMGFRTLGGWSLVW
jgi:hypothetical protein